MKKFLPLLFSAMALMVTSRTNAQGGTLSLNGSVTGKITSSTPDTWNITTTADGLLQVNLTGVKGRN